MSYITDIHRERAEIEVSAVEVKARAGLVAAIAASQAFIAALRAVEGVDMEDAIMSAGCDLDDLKATLRDLPETMRDRADAMASDFEDSAPFDRADFDRDEAMGWELAL